MASFASEFSPIWLRNLACWFAFFDECWREDANAIGADEPAGPPQPLLAGAGYRDRAVPVDLLSVLILSATPKLLTHCGITYLPRGVVKKTGWKQ
jgi:hypothetical protein